MVPRLLGAVAEAPVSTVLLPACACGKEATPHGHRGSAQLRDAQVGEHPAGRCPLLLWLLPQPEPASAMLLTTCLSRNPRA